MRCTAESATSPAMYVCRSAASAKRSGVRRRRRRYGLPTRVLGRNHWPDRAEWLRQVDGDAADHGLIRPTPAPIKLMALTSPAAGAPYRALRRQHRVEDLPPLQRQTVLENVKPALLPELAGAARD